MSFKEILVPYDGSSFANRAFNRALDFAEAKNSRITVIIIIKEEYPPIIGFSKEKTKLMKAHQRNAEKQIERLRINAKKQKIPFVSRIKRGNSIVKEIIGFTKTRKFDLIIMGSHGRTGFKKLMLGSVSSGVLNNSKTPVLIVK